jgi:catechol 2,3-dioxygenase-like lactoylglutathione lyase family enzyme
MLHGIDHVVILVEGLQAAIESYGRLGFTVVSGGRHDRATHNALIGFEDGAYIELIAFWEDAQWHRWNRFLARGGGLVDYCMRTDDLPGDVAILRQAGVTMSEDQPMSRLRPDGYRLEWSLSLATATQGMTPFLIEDVTPRDERVPRQTLHANGVTGISALTVAVADLEVAGRLGALLGKVRRLEREDLEHGVYFVSNHHRLEFVEPRNHSAMAVANRGGGGVWALTLKTVGPVKTIDPGPAHNARLSLVHE